MHQHLAGFIVALLLVMSQNMFSFYEISECHIFIFLIQTFSDGPNIQLVSGIQPIRSRVLIPSDSR